MFETIDSVLNDLEKKVGKLRNLQSRHEDKATYLRGVLEELTEEMEGHVQEAKRALVVSNKIEKLISVD